MPSGPSPTCDCIGAYPPTLVLQWIYCVLQQINANTGGATPSDQYTSSPGVVTTSGSIPAGVLGWSFTAISGTVTFNGTSVPIGTTLQGGGYEGRTSTTAIPYTISNGSAAVNYDLPA